MKGSATNGQSWSWAKLDGGGGRLRGSMGTESGSLLVLSRENKVCGFVLGRINFRKTQCLSHSETRIPSDKYTVSKELSMYKYMHSVFLLRHSKFVA